MEKTSISTGCGSGNLREELACMVTRRWDRNMAITIANVIRFAFDNGWIEPVRAKKAVIKDFYFQMLKQNRGNATESRLDVEANYEVSDSYIQNLIYNKGNQGIR